MRLCFKRLTEISDTCLECDKIMKCFPLEEVELTPDEVADVEVSEKELKNGDCKTFENANDFIAYLHKKREFPDDGGV